MIKRRRLLVLAAAMGWLVRPVAAQRTVRIGILNPRPLEKSLVSAPVVRALSELGYRDGKEMILEYRSTEGAGRSVEALAKELVDRKCDVIFALGTDPIARALRDTRSPIPVVFLATDYDPIEKGLITNLRRPGGRMTGVYIPVIELAGKKLELALDVLPKAKRFLAVSDAFSTDQLHGLRAACQNRRVELFAVEYDKPPYDFAKAFAMGRENKVDAFIGLSSPRIAAQRATLAEFFESYRIPAFVGRLSLDHPGFLAGYTVDLAKAARRTAEIGVRILKGASPADIPVQQADEFELIVNMRTAKALGLKVPYSVLARATQLIQ